jgi:peptidoglycan hydrolase-like protein with peptidoglycan-binding domain
MPKKINYNGAIEDPIDERDYQSKEIGFYAPVNWVEKKEFRQFPNKDQDGSLSCVAQAVSKILGIENYLEEGKYFPLSARDIYVRRSNAPAGGMIYREAMKIGNENGATLESLIPSESQSEVQMNDITDRTPYTELVGRLGRGGAYISIPTNSIDEIASVIATGKAVLLGFRFDYNEWDLDVPVIKAGSQLSCGHGVAGVDFTLYNGKKAIVIDESWGFKNIKQRIITEEWFNGRCVSAWYFENLSNNQALIETTEKYIFNNDLSFGMQNEEVKELHKVLMSFGLLKIKEPTGYFGSLTKTAVMEYQTLKSITPVSGYVGPLTRQALNNYA